MADFASEGHDTFPSLYQDYQQVGDYATWPDEALDRLNAEYVRFLAKSDIMPHHREKAALIASHLIFELMYRQGAFSEDSHDAPE